MFFKKKPAPLTTQEKIEASIDIIGARTGNKLIDALKIVINALSKDIVDYDWYSQGSCNCGVIVQAMLDVDKNITGAMFAHTREKAGLLTQDAQLKQINRTWREVCQKTCSITGMPTQKIFKILHERGLTAADIVHLEYLNNPGILAHSGIDRKQKNYFDKPANLLKYLKAWLCILEGKTTQTILSQREDLEVKLLVAVNTENYEEAQIIKQQMAVLM